MSCRKPEKKKRRTREHVIADLSINHTERQALLAGFAVQRIVRDLPRTNVVTPDSMRQFATYRD
jgi:hypothetical protein